jgi:bifunctional NMN adenylyltransferase/nudix hydrolase
LTSLLIGEKLIGSLNYAFLISCETPMMYDFLVFIGRFQPFHKGHEQVIKQGFKLADKIIIFCGSANQAFSYKNPWPAIEREHMIRKCFSKQDNERMIILPLADIPDNDEAWVLNIRETVHKQIDSMVQAQGQTPRIGLIGHAKDNSSYYLKLFPQWGSVNVKNFGGLNSTFIREIIFKNPSQLLKIKDMVPPAVFAYIEQYVSTGIAAGRQSTSLQD